MSLMNTPVNSSPLKISLHPFCLFAFVVRPLNMRSILKVLRAQHTIVDYRPYTVQWILS